MKREIKFRAWDKTTDQMTNPFGFQQIENSGIGEGAYITDGKNLVYLGWCEIMQFTGLKDKNGKEIYEGDIVRLWDLDSYDKENDKLILEPTDNISFVEYFGHGFWLKDEYFGWEGEGLWSWDRIEVIGNIYENPELLSSGQSAQVSDTTEDHQGGDDGKQRN